MNVVEIQPRIISTIVRLWGPLLAAVPDVCGGSGNALPLFSEERRKIKTSRSNIRR